MTVRILLTGAPCTGKTTLLKNLPQPKKVILLEEVPRRVLDANINLMENRHKLETQKLLLDEQRRVEKQAIQNNPRAMVQDRGYLDVVAYCQYYKHKLPQAWLEGFQKFDYAFLFTTDGVCPIGFYATKEGFAERIALDAIFKETIESAAVPYTELTGTVAFRIEKLNETLIKQFNLDLFNK